MYFEKKLFPCFILFFRTVIWEWTLFFLAGLRIIETFLFPSARNTHTLFHLSSEKGIFLFQERRNSGPMCNGESHEMAAQETKYSAEETIQVCHRFLCAYVFHISTSFCMYMLNQIERKYLFILQLILSSLTYRIFLNHYLFFVVE